MKKIRANIMLCAGTGCLACGAVKINESLKSELQNRGLEDEIQVVLTGCNGFCANAPIMAVYPEGIFYQKLKPEDIPHIVEEHLLKGRPVEKFMYKELEKKTSVPVMKDIPFFNLQILRALRNKGMIDPEKIEDYIARDGYQGAAKALLHMTPDEIVDEIKSSGIRGRGGAVYIVPF